MISNYLTEICAGSAEDVITASRFPIDRIELNSALELGGLTPSLSTLRFAKAHTALPILCMVRPRPAGFVYSDTEYEIMKQDAELLLQHGADGIVFGILNPDHTVDEERTRVLVELAHAEHKQAVFHRAFDLTPDPFEACRTIIRCGADRILTSGQQDSAVEGAALIHELITRFGTEIEILPGAGIKAENIKVLLTQTGSSSFHMTAKSMRHDHTEYAAVDARNIQAIMQALASFPAVHPSILTREDDELLKQELFEKKFDQ